jgi:hypothetical protein
VQFDVFKGMDESSANQSRFQRPLNIMNESMISGSQNNNSRLQGQANRGFRTKSA